LAYALPHYIYAMILLHDGSNMSVKREHFLFPQNSLMMAIYQPYIHNEYMSGICSLFTHPCCAALPSSPSFTTYSLPAEVQGYWVQSAVKFKLTAVPRLFTFQQGHFRRNSPGHREWLRISFEITHKPPVMIPEEPVQQCPRRP